MDRARAYLTDLVRYPSLIGTLAVNFTPLIGVLVWGWGVGPLVLLYWLENVVVGFITLFRMALTAASSAGSAFSLLFFAPFFCFHYGLFCFVHGVFVLALANASGGLDKAAQNIPIGAIEGGPFDVFNAALHAAPGVPVILAIIGGWRLVLMLIHYVLRGEFRTSNPVAEMGKPYGRIITLHFAIFAGAFGLIWLKEPAWGMFGLIMLKAAFDFFGVRSEVTRSPAADEARAKSQAAFQALDREINARLFKRRPPAG